MANPAKEQLKQFLEQKQETLRLKDAAAFLGISKTTLWRLSNLGDLPQPIRLTSRCCVYRKIDLENWLESKKAV